MNLFQWIVAHQMDLLTILISIHAAAKALVILTPTPKDDSALAWVYTNVIEKLALLIGYAKDKPNA